MSDSNIYASSPLFRLRGDVVTSVQDEYGEVMVIDNKIYRILSFDRVFEQSKMQKNNPTLPVHNYILGMLMAVALTPADPVLVLGLGGGSLVRSLYARNPLITIEVVELRQAVLDVARDYFLLPTSEHIHYRVDDAAHFIASPDPVRYALIFSDLYSASAIAPLQTSLTFLHQCAEKLLPDGWLVLNHPQAADPHSDFSRALNTVFARVLYSTAPSGNVVIYASLSPCHTPLETLRQRMKNTGHEFHTDFAPLAAKLEEWPTNAPWPSR